MDNAAEIAIRGVRERAARIETQEHGGVTARGLDAQGLATANADNGEAVTDDRKLNLGEKIYYPTHAVINKVLRAVRP